MAWRGHRPVNVLEIRGVNVNHINPNFITTSWAMLAVVITMHQVGKKHDYVVGESVERYPLRWCTEHPHSNACAFPVDLVFCDIALGWLSVSVGIRNGAFVVSPCVTSRCSSGEPTKGCPQIDENKARSQPGEIFSSRQFLE